MLENEEHGPQLCHAVEESYPPQCSGLDVVGWDWDAADGEETASGTTWGDYHLVGTWDGERFTPTEPPGPPDWEAQLREVDLSTPCPPPEGGWSPVDPERTTSETLQAAIDRAEASPGFAGLWFDQTGNPRPNDPAGLVLNVRTTGDTAELEASLREVYGGAVCISPATHTYEELRAIQATVRGPDVLASSVSEAANVVEVVVTVADDDTVHRFEDRFGADAVEVRGWLRPVG